MKKPQAERIARITAEKTIELDTSTIERIFHDNNILSLPIALMVIGGETRLGNSLITDFAVLYLQHLVEHGYSKDWKESDQCLNGIHWEHGSRSVTEGFRMWNRPFIIERDGKKIALLIVDTPGAGNIEHNQFVDTLLMFTKTCMSPTRIVSVDSRFKPGLLSDLECWQNYLNAHISEEGVDELIQENQMVIIFLVKNWHDSGNFGEDIWRFTTKFDDNSDPSVRKAYKTVEQANSLITAFTFPHPGDKIAKASSTQNCWGLRDFPHDFLLSMEAFFEKFLQLSFQITPLTGKRFLQNMGKLKHLLSKLSGPDFSDATGRSIEAICDDSEEEAAAYQIHKFKALADELFRRGIQIELGNEAANIKELALDEYAKITCYHRVDQDTLSWREHHKMLSRRIDTDQKLIIDEYRDFIKDAKVRLRGKRINVLVEQIRTVEPDMYNYISTYHRPYIAQDN